MSVTNKFTKLEIDENTILKVNAKSPYNEPRLVLTMSDDSLIVITQIQHGLEHSYDWFFTMEHMSKNGNQINTFRYADEAQLLKGFGFYKKKLEKSEITFKK